LIIFKSMIFVLLLDHVFKPIYPIVLKKVVEKIGFKTIVKQK